MNICSITHELENYVNQQDEYEQEQEMYDELPEDSAPWYCEGCGTELEECERIRRFGKFVCCICGSDEVVENY